MRFLENKNKKRTNPKFQKIQKTKKDTPQIKKCKTKNIQNQNKNEPNEPTPCSFWKARTNLQNKCKANLLLSKPCNSEFVLLSCIFFCMFLVFFILYRRPFCSQQRVLKQCHSKTPCDMFYLFGWLGLYKVHSFTLQAVEAPAIANTTDTAEVRYSPYRQNIKFYDTPVDHVNFPPKKWTFLRKSFGAAGFTVFPSPPAGDFATGTWWLVHSFPLRVYADRWASWTVPTHPHLNEENFSVPWVPWGT